MTELVKVGGLSALLAALNDDHAGLGRALDDMTASERATLHDACQTVIFELLERDDPPPPVVDERPPLTDRQRRMLAFIADIVHLRGYPPSMREIGDHVGLRSSSSVHHQVQTLVMRGYLIRDPARPRAITVVPPGAPTPTARA